jgi:CRISPR-associated exonuclease Cas4
LVFSGVTRSSGKYISAGDLEKYTYCPLSWWLSKEFEGHTDGLTRGIEEHKKLGKSLWKIEATEKTARTAEKLVFWWAIVATLFAMLGLELLPIKHSLTLSQILGVVALIWVLAATYFLYRSSRSTIDSNAVEYERIILIFGIVAALVAVNAVAFTANNVRLAQAIELTAVIWLIGASFFLYRTMRSTGIIEALRKEYRVRGEIEYIDMENAKAFTSDRYGLSGRPDYIIKLDAGLIPVEEKKGRTPRGPLFSHILQVAAYCMLIEEVEGKAPPYGILKYPEHEHEIEFNDDLRSVVIEKLGDMRRILITEDCHRNHERPGKCASCSRRDVCPERLA